MYLGSALQLHGESLGVDCVASEMLTGLAKRDTVELAAGSIPVFYPKGGMFFLEGQSATGVFLLRTGRAKESMSSTKGKTAIVRMVAPGAIVGLTAVLTNSSYESTVETLEPTHADFVRKAPFLNVLKTSAPLGQMVVRQFIHESNEAYATIRCLGVSGSVPERIARLLLHWAECPLANQNQRTGEVRIRVTLTHEEISQFVGSTRETTSRILGEFRKKKWIAAHGCIWTIADPSAIRRLAAV